MKASKLGCPNVRPEDRQKLADAFDEVRYAGPMPFR
jgi:hypothetical protein